MCIVSGNPQVMCNACNVCLDRRVAIHLIFNFVYMIPEHSPVVVPGVRRRPIRTQPEPTVASVTDGLSAIGLDIPVPDPAAHPFPCMASRREFDFFKSRTIRLHTNDVLSHPDFPNVDVSTLQHVTLCVGGTSLEPFHILPRQHWPQRSSGRHFFIVYRGRVPGVYDNL
jgi:hypothetical protein